MSYPCAGIGDILMPLQAITVQTLTASCVVFFVEIVDG